MDHQLKQEYLATIGKAVLDNMSFSTKFATEGINVSALANKPLSELSSMATHLRKQIQTDEETAEAVTFGQSPVRLTDNKARFDVIKAIGELRTHAQSEKDAAQKEKAMLAEYDQLIAAKEREKHQGKTVEQLIEERNAILNKGKA